MGDISIMPHTASCRTPHRPNDAVSVLSTIFQVSNLPPPSIMPPPPPSPLRPDLGFASVLGAAWKSGLRVLRKTWWVLSTAWIPSAVLVYVIFDYILNHESLVPLRNAFERLQASPPVSNEDFETAFCGSPGCAESLLEEMQSAGLGTMTANALGMVSVFVVVYMFTLSFTTVLISRSAVREGSSTASLITGALLRTPAALAASLLVYGLPLLTLIGLLTAFLVLKYTAILLALLPLVVLLAWWFGRASLVGVSVGLADRGFSGLSSALTATKSRWWTVVLRLFAASLAVGVLGNVASSLISKILSVGSVTAVFGFILARIVVSIFSALGTTTAQVELYQRLSQPTHDKIS